MIDPEIPQLMNSIDATPPSPRFPPPFFFPLSEFVTQFSDLLLSESAFPPSIPRHVLQKVTLNMHSK